MNYQLVIYRDCKPYLGTTKFETLDEGYEYVINQLYGDEYYNKFDPFTDELIEYGLMNIKTKKRYFVNN